jgi:hypothetical protein
MLWIYVVDFLSAGIPSNPRDRSPSPEPIYNSKVGHVINFKKIKRISWVQLGSINAEILYFFGGRECVGYSFAHFVFLRDVWIRTQRAAVAIRRAANLTIHLPNSEITTNK